MPNLYFRWGRFIAVCEAKCLENCCKAFLSLNLKMLVQKVKVMISDLVIKTLTNSGSDISFLCLRPQ